jgi:hypothetical protein
MLVLAMNNNWPTDNRIDVIGQNGNTGEHYGMKNYKIAAQVAHGGKYLETEVAAYDIEQAIRLFDHWLHNQGFSMAALCELDVSEVVE